MFRFDNTFARDSEGAFERTAPATPPDPKLVVLNEPLALVPRHRESVRSGSGGI